jgi:hypothetical protein
VSPAAGLDRTAPRGQQLAARGVLTAAADPWPRPALAHGDAVRPWAIAAALAMKLPDAVLLPLDAVLQ